MDWQSPAESLPSAFVPEAMHATLRGTPPVSGAWRDGDHPGNRKFFQLGPWDTEHGDSLPHVRLAYETFGELNEDKSNAVLVFHALTGDSHIAGSAGPGHPTTGWWSGVIGPGLAIDTNVWCVIVPNVLGGCQGSTGPASFAPQGHEWGSRFPYLTIRDQTRATKKLAEELGIARLAAVIGGSMGGMHALEWAIEFPDSLERLGLIATSAETSADQLGGNSLQTEAISVDPFYAGGDYYDHDEGPYRGLALARRMALVNYRSPHELNDRFERTWQSSVSPLGDDGRFAVESYLDFHGNKFTRRFDANSYITLVQAMNSHDVTRGRGPLENVLGAIAQPTLVLGIDSDRLFPISQQHELAAHIPHVLSGETAQVIDSPYGHDGFLIESDRVGKALSELLATKAD
ncbi:MAG: homoserine O-acetyltransferase [Pontimonas sp.]|jgi:homoserine O-acetyltransferase